MLSAHHQAKKTNDEKLGTGILKQSNQGHRKSARIRKRLRKELNSLLLVEILNT